MRRPPTLTFQHARDLTHKPMLVEVSTGQWMASHLYEPRTSHQMNRRFAPVVPHRRTALGRGPGTSAPAKHPVTQFLSRPASLSVWGISTTQSGKAFDNPVGESYI